jgi:hypothetical protein
MKPHRTFCLVLGLFLCASIFMFLAFTAEAAAASDYTEEACIECHGPGSEDSELVIDLEDYRASIHSEEVGCQDCHTQVIDDDHQETEGAGAVDCGQCHEQAQAHGSTDEPLDCHACHTRHAIRSKDDPDASIHADQLPITCGSCHPTATGDNGYFSWFPAWQIASHKKGDFAQAYERTQCLGCHQGAGAHGESDPLNDQTCYRCHPADGEGGGLWGKMHPVADRDSEPLIFAAAGLYQVAVVGGLLALFFQIIKRGRRTRVRAVEGVGKDPGAATKTLGRERGTER